MKKYLPRLCTFLLLIVPFASTQISHTFSNSSHTLHAHLVSQMGEAVLLEHCPHPFERQSRLADQRSIQKKCEQSGLSAAEKDKLIVCHNGLEMFNWDLDFLHHAEHSIEALVCFFGGSTGQALLKAIGQRIEEVPTLQVHVLASPVIMTKENIEEVDQLCGRFPHNFHIEYTSQVVRLSPDLITTDNHIKIFVVDETYYSVGGTNFEEHHCSEGTFTPSRRPNKETEADRILPAGMRDQDIVGKGPLAVELRKIFFQHYALWENYNKTQLLIEDPEQFHPQISPCLIPPEREGAYMVDSFEQSDRLRELEPNTIRCLVGGPHQSPNVITQEYVRLIGEAKEEIFLEHLYFFPDEAILKALMAAVNRGVKLTLITNGLDVEACSGASLFVWANRMAYVPLFYGSTYALWDAGCVEKMCSKNTQIYEYSIPDVMLHKKTMLIDRHLFVIGSYNFSTKSAYGDYELILIIDSGKVAADVLEIHQVDLKYSRQVSSKEACGWYFDPFISYWGELQKKFGGFL
jgi:phosphatidylserine/phosphatidylglycerophosphate/cardiolipin synthase-like enzyme